MLVGDPGLLVWNRQNGQNQQVTYHVTLSSETEGCEVLFGGKGPVYLCQGELAHMLALVQRVLHLIAPCTARIGDLAKGHTVDRVPDRLIHHSLRRPVSCY